MKFNTLRYQIFHRLAPLALAFAGVACQGANMFTVQDDIVMGAQAYEEFQATKIHPVIHSGPAVNQVERVTARLVNSALKTGPEIAHLFEWDVCVIDDDDAVASIGGSFATQNGDAAILRNLDVIDRARVDVNGIDDLHAARIGHIPDISVASRAMRSRDRVVPSVNALPYP